MTENALSHLIIIEGITMNVNLIKNNSTQNNSMKKKAIAASLMLAMATTPVMASSNASKIEGENEESRSGELIGFSSGAIIGGLIAGPLGIIAAGTIGVIMGQSHDRQEKIELVETRLKNSEHIMESLKSDKQRLENRLAKSEQTQQILITELALTERTLNQADTLEKIKLNLRFDVGSAHVESFYHAQIKHLAMMMQENPELSVNLSGFSDPTGSEKNNLTLSQARAESVKSMLVSQGANAANISTQAFGESTATQISRTPSIDFTHRRVDVELIPDELLSNDVDNAEETTELILADIN